jgi:hypothetical protein
VAVQRTATGGFKVEENVAGQHSGDGKRRDCCVLAGQLKTCQKSSISHSYKCFRPAGH